MSGFNNTEDGLGECGSKTSAPSSGMAPNWGPGATDLGSAKRDTEGSGISPEGKGEFRDGIQTKGEKSGDY